MDVADLADATACEAASLLRDREVSATELCDAVLSRAAQTEHAVHAYVLIDEEGARATARHIDQRLQQRRENRPLAGIPVAIKDVFATVDFPTEAGCSALRDRSPRTDAAAVRAIADAGGVVVGKTVTHQLAYGQDQPPTRNGANPHYLPGGSSAGSAVAVAAGSAMVALGTDGGGSVRHPAALNGIVGFKPTYGRLNRSGVVVGSPSLDHVGILTRTVDDCRLVFTNIDSSTAMPGAPPERTRRGLPRLRVGVLTELAGAASSDVRREHDRSIDTFKALGATVEEMPIPDLRLALVTGLALTLVEASVANRWLLREAPKTLHPHTRVMLELGELVPATRYLQALSARVRFANALRAAVERARFDILLSPAAPDVASRVSEPSGRSMWDLPDEGLLRSLMFHMWANVAGLPAITIPVGQNAAGLPIGIQLAGRPAHDENLLTIASAFEAAVCEGTRRPFKLPDHLRAQTNQGRESASAVSGPAADHTR